MIINPYIYSVGTAYDPDAQLFITATGITGTNATATNQLVVDLKAANIWAKMKAVYPMVGGTSTTCKFNLKNPVDSNAAFRLTFFGGGTFSNNGYQPNGTNAYGDTNLNGSLNLTSNNAHISFYSRTNVDSIAMDFGNTSNAFGSITRTGNSMISDFLGNSSPNLASVDRLTLANTSSNANFIFSSTSTNIKIYKNSAVLGQKGSATASSFFNNNILFSYGFTSSAARYSNRELAFASIGDGLTDLESQLFYQITEKFQVALGRNINTTQSFYYNSAYNNETNAFLFSTQITDNTIQTATNTLVSDLKTANIFTKMKALYPMVGGTANTCKFNLVNPQDSDAAFRLVFFGGGTFSANGYQPGGVNGYADTFLQPSTAPLINNSTHLSVYSRTNSASGTNPVEIGCFSNTGNFDILIKDGSNLFISDHYNFSSNRISIANANSQGFYLSTRTSSTVFKVFKNNAQFGTTNTSASSPNVSIMTSKIYISALNNNATTGNYSNRELAFSSIGDGLTDAEALAYYNAVQTFNTTLNRQV